MYRSQIQKVECGCIALSLEKLAVLNIKKFCLGCMPRQHTFGTKVYDSRLTIL